VCGVREGVAAIHVVTDRVYPGEPCWGLREGAELRTVSPNGGQEMRWLQKVFVVRGDRKAKYETDFGPASDFPHSTPVIYPSFGENTVAQLQELAERDRHSDKWYRRGEEKRAESTLIADILRQEEILLEVRRNRSQFGPGVSVQRVDYPREAAERQFKEKRDARSRRTRA